MALQNVEVFPPEEQLTDVSGFERMRVQGMKPVCNYSLFPFKIMSASQ